MEDNKYKYFSMVPESVLNELIKKQDQILQLLTNKTESLSEYITEEEAKSIINRGSTWFWNQRKAGFLDYRKVGQTVYYKRESIINIVTGNKL